MHSVKRRRRERVVRKRRLKTVNEKLHGKKAKGCPGYARDYMATRGHPRRSFNATKQEYDFAALGQPRVFLSQHAKKRARDLAERLPALVAVVRVAVALPSRALARGDIANPAEAARARRRAWPSRSTRR